ncbi:hypothetical protein KM043_011285 [Ampulex compressa]|nr:hypothetical protein KM043_011285 [Ampulex compressa]
MRWLPKYSRLDAASDFVAGISLGLTIIPQSIAYAALAGLSAQYGLYSSFLGGFLYILFGTIKEVSIGPTSLMALLTLEYTRNMPVDFVVLLCFIAGCVELMMGLLNLGFMVDFISIPVTTGFTAGTSVIIIISQLQGLLGLKYKSHNILDNIFKAFQNIQNVRLPDFLLGLCSVVFLLLFRKLKDIDCPFLKNIGPDNKAIVKKIQWFLSIGRNAIIILITSVIAFRLDLIGSAPFILSGKVHPGLPAISLPPFSSHVGNQTYTFLDMCSHFGSGMLILPLIAVLANVAIAKAFATGDSVNASQEMLTLGLCNMFGSLVSSMPTCGAFTRSAVSSTSGVRSPMAGLYSGIMTLLALSFLTPYFYYIPRATLAAVLISAVIFMIDWKTMILFWKGCKRDAAAALVTFVLSIICSVEIGLLLGATFNLIFFLRPSARPNIEIIQCKTQSGKKYLMIKPDTGLYYPAVDFFCNKLLKAALNCEDRTMPLVVNCEIFRDMDYTAIKGMETVSKQLNAERNRLWFLNMRPNIVRTIEIYSDQTHFHFIENKEGIYNIFYDNVTTDTDDVKVKLICKQSMEEEINHERLTINNDNNGRQCGSKKISGVDDNIEERQAAIPKLSNMKAKFEVKSTDVKSSEMTGIHESERKRLKSLKEKKQAFKAKEQLVRDALSNLDNKSRNNKIVFDNDTDEVEDQHVIKQSGKSLFDDDEGEYDAKWNDFTINEDFPDKKSILGNDARFVLDNRFTEEERITTDDNVKNQDLSDLQKEKEWQLNILQKVLGTPVTPIAHENKEVKVTKKGMIRYDPTKNDHHEYEIIADQSQSLTKNVKKKKKFESTTNREEAPVVPVSTEIFFSVSDTLIKSLKENKKFSLLETYGKKNIGNDNSYDMSKIESIKHEKFKFKFDTEDLFHCHASDNENKKNEEFIEKLKVKNVRDNDEHTNEVFESTDYFFFSNNDVRFLEATKFFSRSSEVNNEFKNLRRELKQIVRTKIRKNVKRTQPWGRKRNVKRLY